MCYYSNYVFKKRLILYHSTYVNILIELKELFLFVITHVRMQEICGRKVNTNLEPANVNLDKEMEAFSMDFTLKVRKYFFFFDNA